MKIKYLIIFGLASIVSFAGLALAAPGDVINSNTGAGTDNTAKVTIENVKTEENSNQGAVSNSVVVSMNSGTNSASENTSDVGPTAADPGDPGGQIIAGPASFDVAINNVLNTNTSTVGNPEPGRGGGPAEPPVADNVTPPAPVQLVESVATAALPSAGPITPIQLLIALGLPLLGTTLIALFRNRKWLPKIKIVLMPIMPS